ncbi:hypothetical protein Bbelb_093810 [Branchiostoma belcheri]|nr:hypothetical protein Bbelb_093810 [Branchiostoma belcheri]
MAPRDDRLFRVLKTLFLFLALQSNLSSSLYQFSPRDVEMILQDACIVAGVLPLDEAVVAALVSLERAFRYEGGVVVGVIQADFRWDTGEKLRWVDEKKLPGETKDVAFFPRTAEDRNCLILPPKVKPRAHIYTESRSPEVMLEFINQNCNTYRTLEGDVSFQGLHREAILENIFRVADVSSFTMGVKFGLTNTSTTEQCIVNSYTEPTEAETCGLYEGVQSHEDFRTVGEYQNSESVTLHVENGGRERAESPSSGKQKVSDRMVECERIPVPTRAEFFHNYVKRSRPVIITGAMEQWNVFEKWSNDFLRERFGKEEVHIKLTPGGEYEGVEEASLWEDFGTFQIPHHVRDQLLFPDLVVVRPATLNLKFGKFLDLIEETARSEVRNISAYLEYSSIPQYMPSLEADIPGFPFVTPLLTRRHLNMWLSDGNTLGKLHFDPFDNLLCQQHATVIASAVTIGDASVQNALQAKVEREGTFTRKRTGNLECHTLVKDTLTSLSSPNSNDNQATPHHTKDKLCRRVKAHIRQTEDNKIEEHCRSLSVQGNWVELIELEQSDTKWRSSLCNSPRGVFEFALSGMVNWLPTRDNLVRWGKVLSSNCPLCQGHQTLRHVLNSCPVALRDTRYTWRHNSVLKELVTTLQQWYSKSGQQVVIRCDLSRESSEVGTHTTIPPDVLPTSLVPDITIQDPISGKKEVVLFEPHDNSKLYEAHIPEAILGYNNRTGTFRRKTLLDSTSMVMSPVDILKPNFKRFPQFAAALPVNCTIEEGEVLYMPAHWWHEVQSYPSSTQHRNLAINFW